jgi:hypothetical protein
MTHAATTADWRRCATPSRRRTPTLSPLPAWWTSPADTDPHAGRVDEPVDNWWTTRPGLGVKSPVLWISNAIVKNLEEGSPNPLRTPFGGGRNLTRHQRRWPRAPGETSEPASTRGPEFAQASTGRTGFASGVHQTGEPPQKAPSGEAGIESTGVLRGSPTDGGAFRGFRGPSNRHAGDVGLRGPFHLIHGRGLFLVLRSIIPQRSDERSGPTRRCVSAHLTANQDGGGGPRSGCPRFGVPLDR